MVRRKSKRGNPDEDPGLCFPARLHMENDFMVDRDRSGRERIYFRRATVSLFLRE
jgi:hypothetical protein